MDECARCGAQVDEPVELHSFGDDGLVTTTVCSGCCTQLERTVAGCEDLRVLQAFALAAADGVRRMTPNYKASGVP